MISSKDTPHKEDTALLVLKVEVEQWGRGVQNGSPDHVRRMRARAGRVWIKALSPRSGPLLKKVSHSFKGWFSVFFQSSNSPVMLIIILCSWHRQLRFYEFSITFCHSLDNSMRFIKTSWKIHTLGPEWVSAHNAMLSSCHPALKNAISSQGWSHWGYPPEPKSKRPLRDRNNHIDFFFNWENINEDLIQANQWVKK